MHVVNTNRDHIEERLAIEKSVHLFSKDRNKAVCYV